MTVTHDALDLAIHDTPPPGTYSNLFHSLKKDPLPQDTIFDLTVQGHPRHVQTSLLQSMYGWQANSWNPTGILSLFEIFLIEGLN